VPIMVERPVRTPSHESVTDAHTAVLAATRLARITDYRLVFSEHGVVANLFTEPHRLMLRVVEPQSATGERYEVNVLSGKPEAEHLFSTNDADDAAALFAVLAHRHAGHIELAVREVYARKDARLPDATRYVAGWWSGGIADFIAVVAP